MELIYRDNELVVCVKPPRVLSTDEPGGVPELIRAELGDENADVRTVHRLDRAVGGVMVLARGKAAASDLSRQIREDGFHKEYLAVVHGEAPDSGILTDLLRRDRARKMTFVADAPGRDVQEARLGFETLSRREGLSLVRIRLYTGRTHQIRVQFASRGLPLWGERKYTEPEDEGELALWSHTVAFTHPRTGKQMRFSHEPPSVMPWTMFADADFL